MWRSPEQVQQQRMQQLEVGASTLALQVEVTAHNILKLRYFILKSTA